mmetsp:Transcript_36813/g.59530  ORF Transcript_36813/g.59530 Transcript_36813/m.59530 type:complete len:118 (-) Transcript_36813:549-902(-)
MRSDVKPNVFNAGHLLLTAFANNLMPSVPFSMKTSCMYKEINQERQRWDTFAQRAHGNIGQFEIEFREGRAALQYKHDTIFGDQSVPREPISSNQRRPSSQFDQCPLHAHQACQKHT